MDRGEPLEEGGVRKEFVRDRPVLNVRWCPIAGLVIVGTACRYQAYIIRQALDRESDYDSLQVVGHHSRDHGWP